MNNQDEKLGFLQKKIMDIKIAMFRAEMHSGFPLPNNIISTIKADEHGNIWFFTSCNGNYAAHIDQHFYAYLEYYQKGRDARLRISGKASIVKDDTVDDDPVMIEDMSKASGNLILIKLKIMQAEYFENRPVQSPNISNRIKNFFSDLFVPTHRTYDFL